MVLHAIPNRIPLTFRSPFMVQYRRFDFSEEIIMSTLTVPPPHVPAILTQTLDEFVKQQVAEQELADEAAYFEKLAEAQRQQKIWDYYEQEVLKALESDTWIEGTPEFWDKIRQKAQERREARKTSAAGGTT